MLRVEARHRLLVLRLSALGDVIHTIPAVAAIRRTQPGFAIGWVVEESHGDLVESVAPVDRVFPVRMRRWRKKPLSAQTRREAGEALQGIRRFTRGGTSIDFQGLIKSAIIGRLSGARDRVGFDRNTAREGASALFTNRRIAIDPGAHVIEWNMQLAAAVGATPIDPLSVDFQRYPRDRSGSLSLLMHDRPVLLIPGAGRRDKQWPAERFADLASRLSIEEGRDVVVGWGPGEEVLARAISERTGEVRVAPPTDLRELAFLLQHASCVVAGDTGPIHLAAALRVPVVGLYGPTDPQRNGPWGQRDRCVESWSRGRRMDEISTDDVMQKVRAVLADTPV